MLWNFSVQTNYVIDKRRSVFISIDKKNSKYQILEHAVPADAMLDSKEMEKKMRKSRIWAGR